MPQTLEGLVNCHIAARERRKAGKSPWEGTLEFMSILRPLCQRYEDGDDTLTPQELLAGFHAAAAEVRAKVPEAKGDIVEMKHQDLENFVLGLESLTVDDMESLPSVTDHFDELLDDFYDWCDENRWFIRTH